MTRRLSGRVRVVLVGVSFTLMLAPPLAGRQERAVEPSRPAIAPASPLATDGTWLFAATTGGALVRRALKGSGEWETVPVSLAIGAITGLAGSRTALYVADGSAAAIYRVGLDGKTSDTLIHKGPPLRAPADLAVAGPDLFIADRGAGRLFRVTVDGADARRDVVPTGVMLDASAYLGGTDEELVVSSPESAAIIRVGLTGDALRMSVLQRTVDTSALPVTRYEMRTELGPRVVKRDDYPGATRPGPLAALAGLVYVIDQQTNSLFVASLHDARTVRLPLTSGATFKPARVLATSDDLWILDAGRGDVTRWPRMVPVEIRLERAPSEAMVGLYEYLQRARLLSTRTITVQDNVANTLKRESVLPAGYLEDFAPVLCGLNRPLCEPDGTIRPLQAGQPIQVPDLYTESYIDVRRVTLDGTRTLGAVVDADIRDPAFARLQTEDHLKAINRWADLTDPSAHVRDQKLGTFEVPFEAVRYLAAVRVADLRSPKSGLSRLLAAYGSVLKLRSLERAPSRQPSGAQLADPPTDLTTVGQAHDRLRQTIGYDLPPAGEGSEYVGIAEEEIDRSHPAFVDETGGTVIIDLEPPPSASAPPPASSPAAPPPAPPAAGAQTLEVRKFDQADHGTAVASLVAARRGFPATGFAPNSFIVPVHKEEPGLSGDIEYAIAHTPARIFNLSVELQGESESLWDLITRHQDKALFVVAAGNNDAEVCRRTRRYPVCWGDEKNVIVVTGTTLDGQGRLVGSNYSPRFVHVAAPARDFYAAGKGRSYVPVEGTSFATPIVTATAALLRAQGVTEPALIKQRVIASTDPLSTMSGQIVGGRLNVRRALRPPRLAALMQNNAEILVELAPGRQNVEFIIRGTSVPLALRSVRRLQNMGTWYRLAYADADDELHIVSVQVGTWTIRYRLTDASLRPVGPFVETDLAEFQDYLGPVKW